jgi:formylglycine-generating enzyme required for sulfatase activity
MGSPPNETNRYLDEVRHTVTLTQGFWMSGHEVTQGEYQTVMGSNPSLFRGDTLPVEQVSWGDAVLYSQKLTARERATGRLPDGWEYRLPTETQWEYACRAGTSTAMAFGNSISSTQANFNGSYPYNGGAKGPYIGNPSAVMNYAPNVWGLSDMHGNVVEWCLDWYGTYPSTGVQDPQGPPSGIYRVIRGGSWRSPGQFCRSAYRFRVYPTFRSYELGFRIVLVRVP